MKPTIAVALSGGIDSLFAAVILKEQDYRVFGIHFLTGYESFPVKSDSAYAGQDHVLLIKQFARKVGIELKIVDLQNEFRKTVVDYFHQTYSAGLTPNPCLVCNSKIKFGVLLSAAKQFGAEKLATGHYVRIVHDENGQYQLRKGLDLKKDQSYFLAFLTQDQLNDAYFPLGNYTKSQVTLLARQKNLSPLFQKESQDVCFITGRPYSEFLAVHYDLIPQPGFIENSDGRIIGEHKGLHHFTIGQRKGINIPAKSALYVLGMDIARNRLVVGEKNQLVQAQCTVREINWISRPAATEFQANTRLRYRHVEAPSTVSVVTPEKVTVCFVHPQKAITPGQGAVFYQDDIVLGGGIISGESINTSPESNP